MHDIQQACAEAQQACRDAFQGTATLGKDEIKAAALFTSQDPIRSWKNG